MQVPSGVSREIHTFNE